LGFGATNIATGEFEVVIDGITNRAGRPAWGVKGFWGLQFLVRTVQPSLYSGCPIKG